MQNYCAAVLAVTAISTSASQTPERIVFQRTGYSINALDPGPVRAGVCQGIIMQLPVKDGLASNVNVQHQAFSGDLEDFAALSRSQSKIAGWKVNSEQATEDAYVADVVGKTPGIDIEIKIKMHFYFRAIKVGENIILATAAAPESRWEEDKDTLISVVDSLRPIEGE